MSKGSDIDRVRQGPVLVVSDPAFVASVSGYAGDQGLDVIGTDLADTAIQWLITRDIASLVLDLGVGERVVSRVLKVLQSTEELQGVPFLVVADIHETHLAEEAVLKGASSIVLKPVEMSELVGQLQGTVVNLHGLGSSTDAAAGFMLGDDDFDGAFEFDIELDDTALADHKTIPLRRTEVEEYVRSRRQDDATESSEELTSEELEQTRRISRLRWLTSIPRVRDDVRVEDALSLLEQDELTLLKIIDGQKRVAQLEKEAPMSAAQVSEALARLLRQNVISLVRR